MKRQLFPAFIKPKDGSSSINAYRVDNLDDLKLYAEKIKDYIIQTFVSGREYTIDIFCDYNENLVYIDGLKAVIFDLDDTLYSEKDYVKSGYAAIAKVFSEC